jgi:CBS domain-containing protein
MATSTNEPRVKDVMSKDVVAVSPHDTLQEALDLIVENRVSALPVVDARDRCIGMLSTSDLINMTHELDDEIHNIGRADENGRPWLLGRLVDAFGTERVSSQMTETVQTIGPELTITEAASMMVRNRVHRLPVVDGKDRMLGILSTTDIVSAVASGWSKR